MGAPSSPAETPAGARATSPPLAETPAGTPGRMRARGMTTSTARGSALGRTLRALEDALAQADARAREDFELLDALSVRVASGCEGGLLRTLALDESAAAAETLTRTLGRGAATATVNDGEEEESVHHAYARARREMERKAAALVEAHAACRADRMRLLTDLVTASKISSMESKS
ncbi:hypothetical protein BE221DRAFT_189548 [Ostreococcus tauri]|uniref:Uncharacterized protein n=1 Tax=Ostreococcus tauri TaxID=70448 RepID=A0A1Y5II35_OSTTA|nr:hypothetical protein BE221DRAFT_189548 [Ostreococcus tauri]